MIAGTANKTLTLFFLSAVTALLQGGCSCFHRSLEMRELAAFEAGFVRHDDGYTLRISGSCSRSGYVIERIQQIRNERSLQVKVFISPFSRDGFGSAFSTEVVLDDLDYVFFGEQNVLIWRRTSDRAPTEDISSKKPIRVFRPEEQ